MSDSEDIQNLFGKFDGKSQQYQEVARDDQTSEARSRWPLLSSLALSEIEPVPDVGETRPLQASGVLATTHHVDEQAVPSAPASLFSPPRAPEPEPRSEPLPFLRGAAPAFRVQQRPAPVEPAHETKRPAASMLQTSQPADPVPPPVTRRAASATTFSRSIQEPTIYPPVVTPETSRVHSSAMRDFAPPVVPVNQYKPSASPITGVEGDAGYVGDGRRDRARTGSVQTDAQRFDTGSVFAARSSAARAEVAPSSAARPVSILGKLFAPPAPEASPPREPAQSEPRTRELRAVFSRLAGGRGRDRSGEGA